MPTSTSIRRCNRDSLAPWNSLTTFVVILNHDVRVLPGYFWGIVGAIGGRAAINIRSNQQARRL
jgi:hypothetical protein